MQKQWIRLSTIQDIRIFIETVTMSDVLVDLRSQRYLVNGKSIMGIYSLDLQSPIEMIIHSDDCPELMEKLPRMLAAVKPMLSAPESPPRESSPEQKREALLLALKPFLSPERQRAVDTLLQVSHMGLLLKNLK